MVQSSRRLHIFLLLPSIFAFSTFEVEDGMSRLRLLSAQSPVVSAFALQRPSDVHTSGYVGCSEIRPLVPVERYLCFCPFLSGSCRQMLATDPVSMAAGPQYMSFCKNPTSHC